jgi:AraC-like DNA-binding protein
MQTTLTFLFGTLVAAGVFLVSFLLRPKPRPYYFFAGAYFVLALSLLTNLLFATGKFVHIPHFFRVASPLQYLTAPLGFLFVLFTLHPYLRFRWYHCLHLLPFVLHTIGLMPFFMLNVQEKLLLIQEYSADNKSLQGPDGWGLTFGQQLLIKCTLAMAYQGVQWWLLVRFRRTATAAMRAQNKALLLWMQFDTALKTLLTLFILFTTVAGLSYAYAGRILQISAVAADLLLSAGFLIARPEILAGLRFVIADSGSKNSKGLASIVQDQLPEDMEVQEPELTTLAIHETGTGTSAADTVDASGGINGTMRSDMMRVEQYLLLEQPFLNASCDLGSLSRGVHLPARRVSSAINGLMGLSVPEYVNLKRLEYLEQQLASDPRWLTFKVDTLAAEAGFASRAAFYKAFKRLGSYATPAEMLERYRKSGVDILFPTTGDVSD